MKTPVIVVFMLTLLLIASGFLVARDSTDPYTWIGVSIPPLAFLYLTFRVWRDTRDSQK